MGIRNKCARFYTSCMHGATQRQYKLTLKKQRSLQAFNIYLLIIDITKSRVGPTPNKTKQAIIYRVLVYVVLYATQRTTAALQIIFISTW